MKRAVGEKTKEMVDSCWIHAGAAFIRDPELVEGDASTTQASSTHSQRGRHECRPYPNTLKKLHLFSP